MKTTFLFALVILIISCTKSPEIADYPDANLVTVKYDTTVIDSFSRGATPNNMKPKVIIIKDSLSEKKKELENKIKTMEKKQEEKAKELPKPVSTTT